jgi:hypothetical protein
MVANLIRDEATDENVRRHFGVFHIYLDMARDALMRGRRERGQARARVRAAIGHALAFETWRSLVRDQGLGNAQAAQLIGGLVREAAGRRTTRA